MAVERFIDYMAFSAYFQESNCRSNQYTPIPPVRFYNRGYRDKYGIRYYFSNNAKNSKCLVVASGEPMENLRSLRNDYEIINWALDAGGKFSRLDLAVTEWNTFDGLVRIEDVKSWYVEELIDSSLVTGGATEISSIFPKKGARIETVYIGNLEKRAKRGCFRAYDKGVQLNLGEYMATRIELELKRDKANYAACRIAKTNDIAGNFRAYFNVRHKDFDRLMDADAVSTKRGKAKEKVEESAANDKRWAWLINQVAPALKDAIAFDRSLRNDDINLTRFLQASGLLQEEIDFAKQLANKLYQTKLIDNDM